MKIFIKLPLRLKSPSGQSLIEMSLITPVLLVALYIPMDFGIAFLVSNIAGTAVRDAARIGSEIGKSGGDANNRDFTTRTQRQCATRSYRSCRPIFPIGRS